MTVLCVVAVEPLAGVEADSTSGIVLGRGGT